MIVEEIKKAIVEVQQKLVKFKDELADIKLEHPAEIEHGDYSTNIALQTFRKVRESSKVPRGSDVIWHNSVNDGNFEWKNPKEFAEFFKSELEKKLNLKIEVAGPGFINFYLSREFFTKEVGGVLEKGEHFGKNETFAGKKVMVEYTDPNPFKEFHIGHLMDNAIGEAISRLFAFSGADVKRACWQGDVGMHVAMALWGLLKTRDSLPQDSLPISEKAKFLGKAYALGAAAFGADESAKIEIKELNKKIFEHSDAEVNALYDTGRAWSLEYFETIYKRLGTKFDYYFFEGKEGIEGKAIVEEFLKKGVFEKSEGAVVFRGEQYGLHTRVFINSQGLPTYEAKELGLNRKKFELEPLDLSIIVTANEISEYFRVLLKVMELVYPQIRAKTLHLAHGFLKLPEGKMSSRTGNVITGESLIAAVEAMVHKKLEERELETAEKNKIADIVAIGAIKYSILRQSVGSDIIYDFETSISFEGDSGPYLQYSYVRAKSILAKATGAGIVAKAENAPDEISLIERLLARFPEVVERARAEYAPHLVATYLTELAGSFNSYYAQNQIVNASDKTSGYKVALTEAFATVMKNGLWILGIQAPEKM